ncbi:hypothetical protein [Proteiniclasticum aestuarii]|nr:hypothetical protein [Proteiniclasticum aestuarii]
MGMSGYREGSRNRINVNENEKRKKEKKKKDCNEDVFILSFMV